MPAPMAEVAPPQTAAETASVPAAEAAPDPAAEAPRVFHRTALVEHTWRHPQAGRMEVAFELSCSAPAATAEHMDEGVSGNWNAACAEARIICEHADLMTEAGLAACEDQLCRDLTRTLFGDPEGPPARVERVVWKRVLWR